MGRRNCGKCGEGFLGDSWFCEKCIAAAEAAGGPGLCSCGQPAVEARQDEFGWYRLCAEHLEQDELLAAAERGASGGVA
jgi:hypothetical protein